MMKISGPGVLWVWQLPREGEVVPDHPPVRLEVTHVEITREPPNEKRDGELSGE